MAFHWQGGWFWERYDAQGCVRLFHTYRTEHGEEKTDMQLTIDADSWASIVASVSAYGETSETFQQAREFHLPTAKVNTDIRG